MASDNVLESAIEGYLMKCVRIAGGRTVKLTGYNGIPDRLILLPGAIAFAEVKRPKGGRYSTAQSLWHKMLKHLDHPIYLPSTRADVDNMMKELTT